MATTHRCLSLLALTTLPFWFGCTSPATETNAMAQLNAIAPPAVTADKPEDRAGLHNIVTYSDGLICGAAPEGEEGLRSLAAMGVRTVVSVDGATPDVAAAAKLGLRYVHLPITYHGFVADRGRQLAQAVATLPGPIYMHCHHGKHRSAGALAAAGVMNGLFDTEHALARMQVSGTSPDYQGLWQVAKDAKPLAEDQLRADPAQFPAIAQVNGLVAIMTEIDVVWDDIKALQKAGWQIPQDHPDLVPAAASARLGELYAQLHREPESTGKPAEYQAIRQRSHDLVRQLDEAIRSKHADAAEQAFTSVQKSCKECHKQYRDR